MSAVSDQQSFFFFGHPYVLMNPMDYPASLSSFTRDNENVFLISLLKLLYSMIQVTDFVKRLGIICLLSSILYLQFDPAS